jgi:hypothetical protein
MAKPVQTMIVTRHWIQEHTSHFLKMMYVFFFTIFRRLRLKSTRLFEKKTLNPQSFHGIKKLKNFFSEQVRFAKFSVVATESSELDSEFPNRTERLCRATTWRRHGDADAGRAPARPVLAAVRQAREGAVPHGDPRGGPAPRRVHPPPRVRDHRPGEAEARRGTGPPPAPRAVDSHPGVALVLREVGEPPGVVRARAGHGQLRGDHRARHAVRAIHGGVRHRQRHDVGAVPAVRGLLLPAEGAALQAGQVVHLRQHLVHVVLLRRPLHQRLRRRPLPLRRPVRRRLPDGRLLRPGHPQARLRRCQGTRCLSLSLSPRHVREP